MSADEKKTLQTITEATATLPDRAQAYIIAYAEGVITTMAEVRAGMIRVDV